MQFSFDIVVLQINTVNSDHFCCILPVFCAALAFGALWKRTSALSGVDPSVSGIAAWWMTVFIAAPFLWLNPLLIGLKTALLGFDQRGHWPCLCLNHFNASTLAHWQSDKDGAASGQSPSLQNRFGMQALSLFLFLREHRSGKERHLAYWHCYWHDYRFPHSCYHGNL